MKQVKLWLAATAVAVASPASAGEVTGNGDPTPIESRGVASSACAYSGLNDDGAGPNTHVQSYGMFQRAMGMPTVPNPGISCRGNL